MQITHDARAGGREAIDRLRAFGWTDEEILSATQIICIFNYYTRLVDALGVEPEDFMKRPDGFAPASEPASEAGP